MIGFKIIINSINRSFTISNIRLGVIGAGYIAKEHLKVIKAIDGVCALGITSRSISKAEELAKNFFIESVYEDIDDLINNSSIDGLMICVSANQMFEITKKVIPSKIPLFIEKPPGLTPDQTKILVKLCKKFDTKNMVGYNRRYYSIFHEGIKIINQNGGLLGLAIEGHERFWKIAGKKITNEIQENWIYANSTHTIDLLRFFGGEIKNISHITKSLKEKNGDHFVASMEFESGALGTYSSHWYSPGGWAVTLYGDSITVKFNPLENGIWIDTDMNEHEIYPDIVDVKYKPGLYRQMESFVELVKKNHLKSPGVEIRQALRTMLLAEKFSNG